MSTNNKYATFPVWALFSLVTFALCLTSQTHCGAVALGAYPAQFSQASAASRAAETDRSEQAKHAPGGHPKEQSEKAKWQEAGSTEPASQELS